MCQVKALFQSLKLSKGQDPEQYITKLEKLQWKLNSDFKQALDEEDLLIQIINGLGQDYEVCIDQLQDKLDNIIDPLTLEKCREILSNKYQRSIRWNKEIRQ